jgi:hypothetical protein
MKRCYVCKREDGADDREIRPYGEDGQDICFGCMTSDPARETEGHRQIQKHLAAKGPLLIDANGPPRPLTRNERRRLR